MFKKYDKTYRVIVPQVDVKGKLYLPKDDVKLLLGGRVIVEEKLDGANTGIIRHKSGFHLQKRGSLVGTSEHAQFQFFHNWAHYQNYEKIMKVPIGYIIYGELMYAIHTVYYDELPDYFLVFDVWHEGRFLNYEERNDFCQKYKFHQVPLITKDFYNVDDLFDLIPNKSEYGNEPAEGIVIKRYSKKNYTRAKLVREEFVKKVNDSDHWIHKKLKKNLLKENKC